MPDPLALQGKPAFFRRRGMRMKLPVRRQFYPSEALRRRSQARDLLSPLQARCRQKTGRKVRPSFFCQAWALSCTTAKRKKIRQPSLKRKICRFQAQNGLLPEFRRTGLHPNRGFLTGNRGHPKVNERFLKVSLFRHAGCFRSRRAEALLRRVRRNRLPKKRCARRRI